MQLPLSTAIRCNCRRDFLRREAQSSAIERNRAHSSAITSHVAATFSGTKASSSHLK